MGGYNLLLESVFRLGLADGASKRASLPEVMALLAKDDVASFEGLRPHQRQPWHAFLVQLAAIALQRGGRSEPPHEASDWRALLRRLTANWPDDAPWSLVAKPSDPGFLQPPVPGGEMADFRSRANTPDALDMLVTSKNHDLKRARMTEAAPDDWVYALVTLQTFEGFMGRGNYGIARMNGGFGSRSALGILPPGGPGARFCRDTTILLRTRNRLCEEFPGYRAADGVALVWLETWDGLTSLGPGDLDPWFVEVCRRVRLESTAAGRIRAALAGSKSPRIFAKESKGHLGDPWMPIDERSGEAKALSVTADGYTYRRMVDLVFGKGFKESLLQKVADDDPGVGLRLYAYGIARGQGRTDGLHERVVPLSPRAVGLLKSGYLDEAAGLAQERVEAVGDMSRKVLGTALFALLQEGPDTIDFRRQETAAQSKVWLSLFEQQADADFFEALWQELEAEEGGRAKERLSWIAGLAKKAARVLEEASRSVPQATMRRYRAQVRATSAFRGRLRTTFPDLPPYREANHDHAA